MKYLKCTPEKLTTMYDIAPGRGVRDNCGKKNDVDVPYKASGCVGFRMRKHGYPDKFLKSTFVFTGKEMNDSFKGILESLKEG